MTTIIAKTHQAQHSSQKHQKSLAREDMTPILSIDFSHFQGQPFHEYFKFYTKTT